MTDRTFPRILPLTLLALAPLLGACGKDAPPGPATAPGAVQVLRTQDVPGAVGVMAAREKSPGAQVAVVGRVRDMAKGIFTIVDDSIDYCGRGENTDDGCPTPWDYCCTDEDLLRKGTLVVKAVRPGGEPVPRTELGLRQLDLVAMSGRLEKGDDGEPLLVVDSGWFRRERPTLGDHVKFE